jgi:hypothetical protein
LSRNSSCIIAWIRMIRYSMYSPVCAGVTIFNVKGSCEQMSSSATKLVPALCPSNCLHLGNTPQPFSLCRAKWFAYYRGQPQAGKDLKDFQLIVEPQISTCERPPGLFWHIGVHRSKLAFRIKHVYTK